MLNLYGSTGTQEQFRPQHHTQVHGDGQNGSAAWWERFIAATPLI